MENVSLAHLIGCFVATGAVILSFVCQSLSFAEILCCKMSTLLSLVSIIVWWFWLHCHSNSTPLVYTTTVTTVLGKSRPVEGLGIT